MANIARPTKIWDQTLNDWVYLAGVVDTTKSYTYTADQTFPGITATSFNGGPIPGKNFIINGGMDIWQRGTSFSLNSVTQSYTADRWNSWVEGSGTAVATISQQPAGLAGFNYCLRFGRTSNFSAGVSRLYVGRSFESLMDVVHWQGKTLTFSFYARAGAGYSNANSQMWSYFTSGTGTDITFIAEPGSSSVYQQNFTLTTAWQRFTQTVFVPYGNTAARFFFSTQPVGTTATNDYFEITGVQLEEGSVATPFSRSAKDIPGELRLCQRYYAKTYNQGVAPGTATANGAVTGYQVNSNQASTPFVLWTLPVTMRTSPTLTGYSKNTGTSGKMSAGGTDYNFATNSAVNGDSRISAYPASTVSSVVDCYFQMTADAEL